MISTLSDNPLEQWTFDNRFTDELPGDPMTDNNRRQVRQACYSQVSPTPAASPELAAYSREAADLLDLLEKDCKSPEFVEIFSGNRVLSDMNPFAMCYGGHQFGTWAGQLGDGRAINLGEIINRNAERWILQLKGAGPTPYSRTADGLAVLRSSLREFLCSEAMYHLGIPTTRALSLILTGEQVVRDMFYNGNPQQEPGAVVCRLSPSFIRFGNFEILAARKETKLLEQLVHYTIKTDFPHLDGKPAKDTYLRWLAEICEKTAQMINHWMRVGFVHGVMNTDNMSILGLTIDYGPYGWLEGYDPTWTPNTTDSNGRRYCFGNQPYMAQWNLTRLANALYLLIGETPPLQEALDVYRVTFQQSWQRTMSAKLGLFEPQAGDDELINRLLDLIRTSETDYTIFFRRLAMITPSPSREKENTELLNEACYKPEETTGEYDDKLRSWLGSYINRLQHGRGRDSERRARMNRVNPKYVFRNYLAQLAIDKAEQRDYSMIHELLDVLRHPYDEQPEKEKYSAKRPEWARNRPGCSMLSCSS
jgi:uncharacterized protein YdiU (UPF0061 family)